MTTTTMSWIWLALAATQLAACDWQATLGGAEPAQANAQPAVQAGDVPSGAGTTLVTRRWRTPLRDGVPQTATSAAPAYTPVAPAYTLEYHAYIPVPWYGTEPPSIDPSFQAVEIGDVTGDRRNDLLAVGQSVSPDVPQELLVYAQTASGTLAAARRYPIGESTTSVDDMVGGISRLADFNEDGIADVVLTSLKHFTLFASDGKGGLAVQKPQPIYDPAVEVGSKTLGVPMDVNRDGHMDLVFHTARTHSSGFPTSATHSRLVVRFGDGHGGFPGIFSFKTYGSDVYDVETADSMVSGDLNADGIPDLAVYVVQGDFGAQRQYRWIRVFLHDRIDRLVPAYDVPADVNQLAIGDFNRDGMDDLAANTYAMSGSVLIWPQSPAHAFDMPVIARSSEPLGNPIRAADLDNNGMDDLVTAHDGWDRITYYTQSDAGMSDATMRNYIYNAAARVWKNGLAIGDIDGDQCAEVVVAADYFGLRILKGNNCATHPRTFTVCRTQTPVQ